MKRTMSISICLVLAVMILSMPSAFAYGNDNVSGADYSWFKDFCSWFHDQVIWIKYGR